MFMHIVSCPVLLVLQSFTEMTWLAWENHPVKVINTMIRILLLYFFIIIFLLYSFVDTPYTYFFIIESQLK